MNVAASKVRKGALILVNGVAVRVARREKWNKSQVKLTLEDCGAGLPQEGSPNGSFAISTCMRGLDEELEVYMGEACGCCKQYYMPWLTIFPSFCSYGCASANGWHRV